MDVGAAAVPVVAAVVLLEADALLPGALAGMSDAYGGNLLDGRGLAVSDWTRAQMEVADLFARLGIPAAREWVELGAAWKRAWDDAMGWRG